MSVFVVGSVNEDAIYSVAVMPKAGETVPCDFILAASGGKGANQAVAAARAGASVIMTGCVGDDAFGLQIRADLAKDGIDVTNLPVLPDSRSGTAIIFLDRTGENRILLCAGANGLFTPERFSDYRLPLAAGDYVLLQNEIPLATTLAAKQAAHAAGAKVIWNPAPALRIAPDLLAGTDIFTPNETEAAAMSGISADERDGPRRIADYCHDKGVAVVLLTMGMRGVWCSDGGEGRLIPAFAVNTVDTTAAGDTFNGAVAASLSQAATLEQAVVFGQAAAALSVTCRGAQPSIPSREETEAFLASHGHGRVP
ncbi:ribokinase [Telmatospirillum sp.]|uniref:ribokinase n=1 Tax=Telmatospirillum sp. TaxID=2079197 RepID=UPI002851B073|nr:ribokinase [Telmatospirillum sp.]MDR3439389.1 ribokinase [Telmatospirillum sp.]